MIKSQYKALLKNLWKKLLHIKVNKLIINESIHVIITNVKYI